MIAIVLAFLCLTTLGADISKGHSFLDGDTVHAGDFNDLLDLATINTSFFTSKSATTTPAVGDVVLLYSIGASDWRKATVGSLLTATNYPLKFVTGLYTVTSTLIDTNHGLPSTPQYIRWVMVNQTTELGYSVGDEVDAMQIFDPNAVSPSPLGQAGANATNIFFQSHFTGSILIRHKSTGTPSAITTGNWKFKGYATYNP